MIITNAEIQRRINDNHPECNPEYSYEERLNSALSLW